MYKSKTVIREYANGLITTEEEKPESVCYDAIKFSPSTIDKFVEVMDKSIVEYLNTNYPEYATGSIKIDRHESDFSIKYDTGFTDETITINISKYYNSYSMYFYKNTQLSKTKDILNVIYHINESWKIEYKNNEFIYQPLDYHFSGGPSILADFNRGYMSASVESNDDSDTSKSWNMYCSQYKGYEQFEITTEYLKGEPLKVVIVYKQDSDSKEDALLKQTTIYTYEDEEK